MLKENEFIRVSDLKEAINQHWWRSSLGVTSLLEVVQSVSREEILAEMWHNDAKERPKKSGTYLTKTESEVLLGVWHYAHVNYSKKYDRWNCFDCFSQEDVDEKEEYCIDFWTEVNP